MATLSAAPSGHFSIGSDLQVTRLGFGAMRITGPGIWREPADRGEALRVLRRLPELGIDLIDTADSYGPAVSEDLIREALHPYRGITIATKGGLVRPAAGVWEPVGRPAYLRQCVEMSLRRLKLDRIDLWQLHRIDPQTPRDAQFEVIAKMREEGLIRHVGLSQVSVEEIEAAGKFFPVVTTQNRYNIGDRADEAVLDYCTAKSIGFIPWYPLGGGDLAKAGSVLTRTAATHHATAGQVSLAWLLHKSRVILPIPGTGSVAHLEENVAAATLRLDEADMSALEAAV